MATALDLDLQSAGTHCTHCFRSFEENDSLPVPNDPLNAIYCSQTCQVANTHHSHNILFSLNPAIPPELNAVGQPPPPPPTEAENTARKAAQEAFIAHVKAQNEIFPLLVLRFIARMFVEQTQKVASIRGSSSTDPTIPDPDLPEPDAKDGTSEYSFYDHVEPLKYHEVAPDAVEQELKLAQDLLEKAVEGLTGFVTDEQYALFKGKVVYNTFGVCFSGGRDDRVSALLRPRQYVPNLKHSSPCRLLAPKTKNVHEHRTVPTDRLELHSTGSRLMWVLYYMSNRPNCSPSKNS